MRAEHQQKAVAMIKSIILLTSNSDTMESKTMRSLKDNKTPGVQSYTQK